MSSCLVGGPEIIKKDYGVTVNQYKGINKSQYQIICAEKVMRPTTTRQCHIRKSSWRLPISIPLPPKQQSQIKNKPQCSPCRPTKAYITTKEFAISCSTLGLSQVIRILVFLFLTANII